MHTPLTFRNKKILTKPFLIFFISILHKSKSDFKSSLFTIDQVKVFRKFFLLLLFLFSSQILLLAALIYLLLFLSYYHYFAKGRIHILHIKVLDNII